MGKREAYRYAKEQLLRGLSEDVRGPLSSGGWAEELIDDLEAVYDRADADEIVDFVFYEVANELERRAGRFKA